MPLFTDVSATSSVLHRTVKQVYTYFTTPADGFLPRWAASLHNGPSALDYFAASTSKCTGTLMRLRTILVLGLRHHRIEQRLAGLTGQRSGLLRDALGGDR